MIKTDLHEKISKSWRFLRTFHYLTIWWKLFEFFKQIWINFSFLWDFLQFFLIFFEIFYNFFLRFFTIFFWDFLLFFLHFFYYFIFFETLSENHFRFHFRSRKFSNSALVQEINVAELIECWLHGKLKVNPQAIFRSAKPIRPIKSLIHPAMWSKSCSPVPTIRDFWIR